MPSKTPTKDSVEIRILKEDKSDVDKKITVTYNKYRLDISTKRRIEKKTKINQFGDYDTELLQKQKGGKLTEEEEARLFKIKPNGVSDYTDALEDANYQLTILMWGLTDLDVDLIYVEDFEKLLEITLKRDPAKVQAAIETAKTTALSQKKTN